MFTSSDNLKEKCILLNKEQKSTQNLIFLASGDPDVSAFFKLSRQRLHDCNFKYQRPLQMIRSKTGLQL